MASAAPDTDRSLPGPGPFLLAMSVLFIAEAFASIESIMLLSALPSILREFEGSGVFVWLVASYGLVQAVAAAIGARLGDLYGRRVLLMVAIAIAGVGSVLSALGPNLEVVAVGRALQGATGAILPLGYGIVREITPSHRAPFWIGVLTGGFAFSAAFGYVIGGLFADSGHWRHMFLLTAALAAMLVPLIWLAIPRGGRAAATGGIDWLGAVLFAPGIALVLLGISRAQDRGWLVRDTWLTTVVGALILASWVVWEARHASPLINVRLFRRPQIVLGSVCAALCAASLSQLALVALLLMQQKPGPGVAVGLGLSATLAGLLKLPSNVTALLGAPYSGWVCGRAGARWAIFQGAVLGAAAWTSLYFFHDHLWQVLLATLVGSTATTMVLAGLPNMVLEGVPLERTSEVTGLNQVMRATAYGIGAMVIGMLLNSERVSSHVAGQVTYSEKGYQFAMAYIAGVSALLAILCLVARYPRAEPASAVS